MIKHIFALTLALSASLATAEEAVRYEADLSALGPAIGAELERSGFFMAVSIEGDTAMFQTAAGEQARDNIPMQVCTPLPKLSITPMTESCDEAPAMRFTQQSPTVINCDTCVEQGLPFAHWRLTPSGS